MRVTLLTVGSRGDVQPYVALGRGLRAAGHEVVVATHEPFRALVTECGLGFRPVAGNVQEVFRSEAVRRALRITNPAAFLRELRRLGFAPFVQRWQQDALEACREAGAIVFSPIGIFAYHVAEALGVPAVMAALVPQGPTHEHPTPLLPPPRRPLPGWANRLSHVAFDWGFSFILRGWVNAWRVKTLGLPPWPLTPPYQTLLRRGVPILYGYSPAVVPRPADWPALWHVTGYWFLEPPVDWQPPEELNRFLADGPPPVYVGFGSMTARDPRELTDIAVEALRAAGQRGVLLSGWAGLATDSEVPDHVCVVSDVPHAWLFPRVATVVHHGGAGTTAAGLRAGVPTIVTPVGGDQAFWGARVARLGAGPPPIPSRELTAARLAAAIRTATTDPGMRRRAAALGERIRAEDGVAAAVAAFEQHIIGAHCAGGEAALC